MLERRSDPRALGGASSRYQPETPEAPMKLLHAILAAALVAPCGCASTQSDAERLALYRAHAQPAVASFRYWGINGWTPLGDSALAIWTRPSEAYLLEIAGPCPDLGFAQSIALTNNTGSVYARFDKVIPRGSGGVSPIPCPIHEIRPLDVKALRSAERDMRRQREQAGS